MTNLQLIQNKNKFQSHTYHLVDQSPWPFLISWTLFFMAIGAVLYMHGFNNGWLLFLGFILTSSVMYFWLGDVNTEGSLLGNHTKEVKNGLMIGFILFVISEVFAFLSVFWAYFHSSIVPSVKIGGYWPPLGIVPLNPFSIPLLNTFLLLSSGAFITYGHHAFIAGKRIFTINFFITIVLAVVFTLFQYIEYTESGFSISDSVFGSSFYASTGLHGVHVIIGTIFIFIGFIRIINYNVTKQGHLGIETAILYWHFVDVVWLFLFIAVYFWGSN
uniref:Cytochrome c oxidase subunit 3 n=1 Tax=Omphalotus japonicus TaxID=72119 RepID=A0A6M8UGK1_9AGAR|nr:cytochrome c oxidase subunit 3 [Omphalotus japonicus]QKJ84723.1 cytochrome c oxidase subunit 3 [Omphalotus japonicus]